MCWTAGKTSQTCTFTSTDQCTEENEFLCCSYGPYTARYGVGI